MLLASLLFGACEAVSGVLQGLFAWIPAELINVSVFVTTVAALYMLSRRPAGLATSRR